ncbi:RNA cap guanine-N2 methyltransferase family protein [Cryptosporidium meleagridis]|uniref:Trimethylguanosine synthase n=1 Tax=Cryptosporidium meleagridis TaxID=93969 RepID=A0A2P4Z6G3_9CRYT|nr:RNA cap guanine-N2 methyltransferase family protein [Cryptosporidium meleagridis]
MVPLTIMNANTKKRKRKKISQDGQTNELTFFENGYKKNVESSLKSSFTGNELVIIKGKISSWLNLVSNSSLFPSGIESILNSMDNKELFRGIIVTRRITNLPIRYTNMPGSVIPNLCKNSLYSVSERFPCTPLNSEFEKENFERISFDIEKSNDCELEEALFGVLDSPKNTKEGGEFYINKKRKKETKLNVDFLKKKLSIFPGNVGREYLVFQKYDDGIILDGDAVMDATPEILSQHIARRLRGCTVLDACGGVGSNTIAFSQHCKRVISVEVSNSRTLISKHNSQIYKLYGDQSWNNAEGNIRDENSINEIRDSGSPTLHFNIAHSIDESCNLSMYFDPKSNIVFVNGDILDFCDWYQNNSNNKYDFKLSSIAKQAFNSFENFEWAFASPPWGGYSYNGFKHFNLENNSSLNYKEMIIRLSSVANNIALFLPRNTNITEFSALLSILGFCAIEIEAIRDTRFNYILGIVLYSVRTRSKFKLQYLFGQNIDSISRPISKRLISFTEQILSKSKLDESESVDEQNISKLGIKKISKFGKKIEKLIKKKGLEPMMAG